MHSTGTHPLRAVDLHVTRSNKEILQSVDLCAYPGEILALLGPNGAGKSTLLKAVAGLLPYRGQIHWGDCDLSTLAPRERARMLAYVPQRSSLRSALRVEEVVAQGRYARPPGNPRRSDESTAVTRALRTARALDLAGRSFTKLSVGEQQRVLLARALATEAPVLLLDEPTAALDIGQSLSIFKVLRTLADDGRTIVVVLHNLDDAHRFSDRAVLLDRGRIVESGDTRSVVGPAPLRSVYGVRVRERPGLAFELAEEPDEPDEPEERP